MTEISVVTVSAAILTDEHIGVRELLGVVLISLGRPCRSGPTPSAAGKLDSPDLGFILRLAGAFFAPVIGMLRK